MSRNEASVLYRSRKYGIPLRVILQGFYRTDSPQALNESVKKFHSGHMPKRDLETICIELDMMHS